MIDLTGIKNIIFDLGGVILNIDYNLTPKAFESIGIKGFEHLYSQAQQNSLFDDFEKGLISPQQFRENVCQYAGLMLTDEQIDNAWNAMLLQLPAERLQILNELKPRYRTFLLSNTNAIHITQFHKYLGQDHGVRSLDPFFEKVYLSYEMGKRKPDTEIFEFVLKQQNLLPHETLFIDDSIQHIKGALKTGIRAYHLCNPLTINSLFGQPK